MKIHLKRNQELLYLNIFNKLVDYQITEVKKKTKMIRIIEISKMIKMIIRITKIK